MRASLSYKKLHYYTADACAMDIKRKIKATIFITALSQTSNDNMPWFVVTFDVLINLAKSKTMLGPTTQNYNVPSTNWIKSIIFLDIDFGPPWTQGLNLSFISCPTLWHVSKFVRFKNETYYWIECSFNLPKLIGKAFFGRVHFFWKINF